MCVCECCSGGTQRADALKEHLEGSMLESFGNAFDFDLALNCNHMRMI